MPQIATGYSEQDYQKALAECTQARQEYLADLREKPRLKSLSRQDFFEYFSGRGGGGYNFDPVHGKAAHTPKSGGRLAEGPVRRVEKKT